MKNWRNLKVCNYWEFPFLVRGRRMDLLFEAKVAKLEGNHNDCLLKKVNLYGFICHVRHYWKKRPNLRGLKLVPGKISYMDFSAYNKNFQNFFKENMKGS